MEICNQKIRWIHQSNNHHQSVVIIEVTTQTLSSYVDNNLQHQWLCMDTWDVTNVACNARFAKQQWWLVRKHVAMEWHGCLLSSSSYYFGRYSGYRFVCRNANASTIIVHIVNARSVLLNPVVNLITVCSFFVINIFYKEIQNDKTP